MMLKIEDELTNRIIGIAIEVHRELGPGFLESIYEEAMAVALAEGGMPYRRQLIVPIKFHGRAVGEHRVDLLISTEVVVELKAIKAIEDVHYAVMRSYLRATGCTRGLLLNFAGPTLQVKRIGADFRDKE
jgi:GxxExxY protein